MTRKLVTAILILMLAGVWSSAIAKSTKKSDSLKRRAFIGIGTTELPDSMRARIAPDTSGIYIIDIVDGASADKFGLKVGDVLLRMNGVRLRETGDVRKVVYGYKGGDELTAEYWHDGQRVTKTTALTEYPRESAPDFDIVYDAFRDGDSLRRVIITKPRTPGKHPVVVYVPGVGAFDVDRNKDVYEYPLQNLLYDLTRAGFVTVRMDKPGQGDSQGPPTSMLSLDGEVNFFVNGLNALANWKYMDPERVVLLAHSSGSLHAPLIAARFPVKGIVAMNAVGTGWFRWELGRERREFLLSGLPYDSVETLTFACERGLRTLCFDERAPDPAIAKYMPRGLMPEYWQELAALNVPAAWKTITAPVLVIAGSSDYVTPEEDARAFADMLNSFHAGQATVAEFYGLDHELRTMPTWKASYEQTQELMWFGPTDQDVTPKVVAWVKQVTAK